MCCIDRLKPQPTADVWPRKCMLCLEIKPNGKPILLFDMLANASNWHCLLCIHSRLAINCSTTYQLVKTKNLPVRPADGACAILSPVHIHKRYDIAWLRSMLAP